MVTHNANLVVNADADLVIVAESTDSLPNFGYRNVALADAQIVDDVCDILEGGHKPFADARSGMDTGVARMSSKSLRLRQGEPR